MRPWAFKVRGGGNATGIKGGQVKAGIQGGVGALYSQDAVFTIATHQDQWIATPPLTDNQYQYSHQMNHPIGKPLRYVSVCSGMEAASVAWHPLGWTPVGFSEIEPFPCAILKHRFPNVPNYGSLTEHHTWPVEPGAIDLLVGGTPCQSFSVAGLRKGLDDPRGNLALTFLGLADRLKPKWIVWENVPGVLSSGGGRDFGSFLGALVELGYGFAYRVLDAQYVGGPRAVPQRRRRVFVVACLGDWRAAAEVLSLREGLRGYLEAGGKKRKGVAADAGSGVEAGCEGVAIPFRKSKRACSTTDNETWVPADVTNTLNNFDLGDTRTTHAVVEPIAIQGTIIGRGENAGPQGTGATEGGPMFTLTKADIHGVATPMAVRRLTPVECERLQGFPDNWSRISWKGKPETECPDGPRYKACGNSMAVPVMRWIGERIANYELNNPSQNHEAK